jgi:hypothetical protein
MPSSDKGFVQAYNAQAAVDIDTMLIVESHISQAPNDKQEIIPTLAALNELPEKLGKIDTMLADAGYYSDDNVALCGRSGIESYIPQIGTSITCPLLNDSSIRHPYRKMQSR